MIARPQRVTVQEISRCSFVGPRQFVNLATGPEPNPRRAARTCCQQLGWRPRTVATRPTLYGVVCSPVPPADFVAPAFAGTQAARANPPPSSRRRGAWPLPMSGSIGGAHANTTRWPARRPMRSCRALEEGSAQILCLSPASPPRSPVAIPESVALHRPAKCDVYWAIAIWRFDTDSLLGGDWIRTLRSARRWASISGSPTSPGYLGL